MGSEEPAVFQLKPVSACVEIEKPYVMFHIRGRVHLIIKLAWPCCCWHGVLLRVARSADGPELVSFCSERSCLFDPLLLQLPGGFFSTSLYSLLYVIDRFTGSTRESGVELIIQEQNFRGKRYLGSAGAFGSRSNTLY